MDLYASFRPAAHDQHSIDRALEAVALNMVQNDRVETYSGGMKRRLSLSSATLGNPFLVTLDEPTNGLDPVNRRRVWRVIEQLKKDRVVLLTTHSMEEADALADHVCILHHGVLKGDGSPALLKAKLGNAFEVVLRSRTESEEALQNLVKELLPGCEIVLCAAGRSQVAVHRSQAHHLPGFFKRIKQANQNRSSNEQRACSISQTTLEQVFLSLCEANESVQIQFWKVKR